MCTSKFYETSVDANPFNDNGQYFGKTGANIEKQSTKWNFMSQKSVFWDPDGYAPAAKAPASNVSATYAEGVGAGPASPAPTGKAPEASSQAQPTRRNLQVS